MPIFFSCSLIQLYGKPGEKLSWNELFVKRGAKGRLFIRAHVISLFGRNPTDVNISKITSSMIKSLHYDELSALFPRGYGHFFKSKLLNSEKN